ncbi:MAG: acyltransferase [Patescibacteria group bacterium]
MDRKRFDEVDVLKAFGIIGVIIIHILTRNLTNPISNFLWNNLQFFVISFVFCSGFVLASIYQNSFSSVSKTLAWYKKRLIRLLIPFFIYLISHYALWIIFPNIFNGLGLVQNLDFFTKSALLIGGTNYNFLVVLFVELTLLFPIFTTFFKRKKFLFLYLLLSGIITFIFTFFGGSYPTYRFTMWIPWSLVLIFAMYVAIKGKSEKVAKNIDKIYLLFGVIFFILFLGLYFYNLTIDKSLIFYNHKYPPDFYYLFFGLSLTCFALIIGRLKFWQNKILKSIYLFISRNSYSLFFIHFIILDAVLIFTNYNIMLKNSLIQFSIIFSLSILIIIIINKVKSIIEIS